MRGGETEENEVIYWIIVIKKEKCDLNFVWVQYPASRCSAGLRGERSDAGGI